MSHDPLPPSHRALLDALKHRGRATVPELAADLDRNIETIREHLRTLTSQNLVARDGTVQRGPGRPEVVFGLTDDAEALFPRREGEILHALGRYLVDHGQQDLLRNFFDDHVGMRRDAALARVAHLTGPKRLAAVVQVLEEMGFMPQLEGPRGAQQLRLCHCPMRDLVDATDIPCRAEVGLLTELLGTRPTRTGYIPDGANGCSYAVAEAS